MGFLYSKKIRNKTYWYYKESSRKKSKVKYLGLADNIAKKLGKI